MPHALTMLDDKFLGHAPRWYKLAIIGFLIVNPIVWLAFGGFLAGWLLLLEFILTLAMALRCYPLQPGGLLALQAVAMGMTTPDKVYAEVSGALPVLLLLIFMVAGVHFLRDFLYFVFSKILLGLRSRYAVALAVQFATAILSAFLDALTVLAVLIMVGLAAYQVYHKFCSGKGWDHAHDAAADDHIPELSHADLVQFRGLLRSLMMHGAVGTALGGVATLVGEPQNLLIGAAAGWDFVTFFLEVAHVSLPVLAGGLLTCLALERLRWFGFGVDLPESARTVLTEHDRHQRASRRPGDVVALWVQGSVALLMVLALGFHVAEVGLVGLAVLVLATAFNGITDERRIGHAFEEALPFTALLAVFFAIVSVIHDQHLFAPVIGAVLAQEGTAQEVLLFVSNGLLSMLSDNVFVASVYVTEVAKAFEAGQLSREQFDALAVAINTGTNIPSVATPNGQAAFLFLLTSPLAPLIRLSYGRMVWMALPYTIVLTTIALAATIID